MIRISGIRMELDETDIRACAARKLKISKHEIKECRMIKKAVDARRKTDIHYICTLEVTVEREQQIYRRSGCKTASIVVPRPYIFPKGTDAQGRPVIVGAGPAGLFCTLMLAEHGYRPILIERGSDVDRRTQDVQTFWHGGILKENSNVQFGEGGAGTFSDGKLTTGIKDIRCRKVLEEFVRFGATEDILYLAKPHIGTDKLRLIVKNIREHILACGGEVRFNTKLDSIEVKDGNIQGAEISSDGGKDSLYTRQLVLAIGHSARDTVEMLKTCGVLMERKPFSVGARIEHPQILINQSQYGTFYDRLGAADYKFAIHLPGGRTAYTFCMCPGGMVVAAASEKGHVVTNGMSNYKRDGENANSALLVEVRPSDFQHDDVLAGVYFQREIERRAYLAGGKTYAAPAQLVGDFLAGRPSCAVGKVHPTYQPSVAMGDIAQIFPSYIGESMKQAIIEIDKKLAGFADYDALLTAPETRSSSPVRIIRDEKRQANIRGLYPCGEGAGYAGGIMSAAVDGIKTAEVIAGAY